MSTLLRVRCRNNGVGVDVSGVEAGMVLRVLLSKGESLN